MQKLLDQAANELAPKDRIEILRRALEEAGDSIPLKSKVNFHLGQAMRDNGDCLSSLRRLRMSLKGAKDPSLAFETMAECLIRMEQIDQAARLLEKVLQTGPERSKPYALKGIIYESQGMMTRAIDEYTRALRHNRYSTLALDRRSRALIKQAKPRQALQDIDALARLKRLDPEIFMTRARINLKLNEYKAALNDFAMVEKLLPPSEKDKVIRERAMVYLKMGEAHKALETLEKHTKGSSRRHEAMTLKARALLKLKRVDEARRLLSYTIEKNPAYPAAYLTQGETLTSEGKFDQALGSLNRAIRLDDEFAAAYKERAKVFMELKDYARAADDLGKAMDLDPSDGEVYALRALTFMERLLYNAAVDDFAKALECLPKDPEILFDRARAYYLMDEPEKALEDIETVLEQNIDSARALSFRGVLKFELDRTGPAENDMSAAIELDPDDPQLWNNRGFYHLKRGDLARARADIEKALELAPSYETAKRNMGLLRDRKLEAPAIADMIAPSMKAELSAQ